MEQDFASPSSCDVAILTVIGPELHAMRAALGVPKGQEPHVRDGSQYWIVDAPNRWLKRPLRVVIHAIGNAGQAPASAAATWLRGAFTPAAMILAGIAAGRRKKTKIGDVVLARAVVDHTHQVASKGKQLPRPTIPPLPHPMRQMLAGFELDLGAYYQSVDLLFGGKPTVPPGATPSFIRRFGKEVRLQPTVSDAEIASADLLLRDPKILERLSTEIHQGIKIGEMEAAGFIEACARDRVPTAWLVARGVSDFGDHFKSDDFHRWASCTVAAWVRQFLQNGFHLPTALPTTGTRTGLQPANESTRADLSAKLSRAQDLHARDEQSQAIALLEEVYHAARSHGLKEQQLEAALSLGFTTSDKHNFKSLERWLRDAEKLIHDVKTPWHKIQYHRLKAKALRHDRRSAPAEKALLKAIELSESDDRDVQRAGLLARSNYVHLLCDEGRQNEASPHLDALRSVFVVGVGTQSHPIALVAEALTACIHWSVSIRDKEELEASVKIALRHGESRDEAICIGHTLHDCANGARAAKDTEAAVICADAAERLGNIAQRPDMAFAAAYTAAGALAENGDYQAAQERCLRLVDAAKALNEPKLRFCLFQLLSQASLQLGDKTTAVEMAEAAVRESEGDSTAISLSKWALAEALRDVGRVKEAITHARAAKELSAHAALPPEWIEEVLVLISECSSRLGDWATAEEFASELGKRSAKSPSAAHRRHLLKSRIRMHRLIHDSLNSVILARAPLVGTASAGVQSVHAANSMLVKGLVTGWLAFPNATERIYDYWGRGNLLRVMQNLRAFPHSFNVTLEVHTVEQARQAVRLWALVADVVVLIWKGPTVSSAVVSPVPASMLECGGGGYFATRSSESPLQMSQGMDLGVPRVELPSQGKTPMVITGNASLFPPEVGHFLSWEAIQLVASGRLLLVPGTGICCVESGHGPLESLFAEACNAMPAIKGDSARLPASWLPYFPDIPLDALADVAQEHEASLHRLRMVLIRKTRQLRTGAITGTESRELELELQDCLSQMVDDQAGLRRKHNWSEAREAVVTRNDGFSEEHLRPILVLQNMGYRWKIEPTFGISPVGPTALPKHDEPIGTWLQPAITKPQQLTDEQLRELRRRMNKSTKRGRK